MIVEGILDLLYGLLFSIVDMLPVLGDLPGWIDNTLNVLSYGLMFFPLDVFVTVVGSFAFWMSAHMVWAFIEWVYKKIPGVD